MMNKWKYKGEWNKGRKRPDVTLKNKDPAFREKVSAGLKGKVMPSATREKIRVTNKKQIALFESRSKRHDEILDMRIERLLESGARILTVDYSTNSKRSKRRIPDVLYYLNGNIIGEDVKYTGEVQVESVCKLQ